MILLYADKNQLTVREGEPLTSGAVNAFQARFEFSPDWEGLTRKAVFQAGGKRVCAPLDENGVCTIPWEVLEKPLIPLKAGVYGTRDDTVLPSAWAKLGTIRQGAVPGGETRPPTPALWQQTLAGKGDRLDYTQEGKLGLYAGNKLLSAVTVVGGTGGTGGGYGVGHGLKLVSGNLSVDTVDGFSGDNTLPMTAAGVQTAVGSIEALLGTI